MGLASVLKLHYSTLLRVARYRLRDFYDEKAFGQIN
jgi:hypothetical protein